MIKAIETTYKGYRFRSRTEARWAVFFDTLDVAWEYEKEGYDLGEAGCYLPDFWLPSLHLWVEVKGSEPTPEEYAKAKALCEETGQDVAIVSGAPWFNIFRALFMKGQVLDDATLAPTGREEVWDISDYCNNGPIYDYEKLDGNGCYYQGWLTWGINDDDKFDIIVLIERDDVRSAAAVSYAYRAARSARFEHGESGAA